MTKTDLVNYVAEETGLTKEDALTGFATFTAKKKDAKKGRNPRTGEVVNIPARVAVTVKAGSKLKDALN